MRYIHSLALAVALQIPAAVPAQQVAVGGWVNRVDTANSTITIRTLANPRTIQVAPNAVVRVNGKSARLDQIPANSEVNITTERGPTGVLTATQITVGSSGSQPSAAAPPGSTVQGTLVGMNIPNNTVTLRTTSGDHVFSLGSAPILVNGVRGSIRSFRLGQTIQIQRSLPTEASTDYVTQTVWVLPARYRVAGYQAMTTRPASRTTVRSRARAYRKTSRSRTSSSHRRTRTAYRRTRTRTRRQAMRDSAGIQAAAALAGTAPMGAATVAPGVVTVAPTAVVSPGVVYVTPGAADFAVPPVTAVPAVPGTGGVIVAAPATIAPDARQQAGATAVGTPNVRNQAAASSVSAAGVGNPRNQAIVPNAVGAGAIPAAPGEPDPRFQSTAPVVVPGAIVPAVPGAPNALGRRGFIRPRVVSPRPMIVPTAPR